MTALKKRIVIIEDHPLVRERLADLFNKDGSMEVCGEAEDAQSGMELVQRLSPDLAIVDITLKNSSGLQFIKRLRALSLPTPVLVLSMHDESAYAQRAFRAGASGYISKNRGSAEVLNAARQVLAGEVYVSQEMSLNVLRKWAGKGIAGITTRSVDRLSDRELAVLEMVGQGRNSRAIAEKLGVRMATVDTYRARIKEKMNLQNSFELQDFAIRWLRERE